MWNYKQPVEIVFCNGVFQNIASYIPGSSGLLITSQSFIKRGVAERIKEKLNDKILFVFSNVSANPDIMQCHECLRLVKDKKIEFIIALGGGSVIDVAKVISVAHLSTDDISMWLTSSNEIPAEHIDVYAIPTTAGTGSEVTCVSVISNHKECLKKPLQAESFYPKMAIIDPELTYSLPKEIISHTGFDVLCHAIEAYWNVHHQPICDVFAIRAIILVLENLKTAYDEPCNIFAREKMSEASVLAGLAFALPKTTAIHACSYPLTNILKIPHGEACALTIAYFIKFNYVHGDKRVKEMVTLCGFKSIEEFISTIVNLRRSLQMLSDLKTFQVSATKLEKILDDCQNNNLLNNPIEVKREDLREMFLELL